MQNLFCYSLNWPIDVFIPGFVSCLNSDAESINPSWDFLITDTCGRIHPGRVAPPSPLDFVVSLIDVGPIWWSFSRLLNIVTRCSEGSFRSITLSVTLDFAYAYMDKR